VAKSITEYVCSRCGHVNPQWLGRCPACEAWDTFVERAATTGKGASIKAAEPVTLTGVESAVRAPTGIAELDRVLGGGVVPGSSVLLGGDPGVGKSTLALQLASSLAGRMKTLYVAGEETPAQLGAAAARLGAKTEDVYVLPEHVIENVVTVLADGRPGVCVVDSVQTVHAAAHPAPPGSLSQLKTSTMMLTEIAKSTGTVLVLIGHVTKSGDIAGPKALEHIVDVVLYLEGDRHGSLRFLRASKNRFGATGEVGVFQMTEKGLAEVERPSELFLAERRADVPGSAVIALMEGSRPVLAEVQALTSASGFSNPQRVVSGVDVKRLAIILAVLDKRLGYDLSRSDVFVNAVGGLYVNEPAADLGVTLAIASSVLGRAVDPAIAAFGEVGLAGEVRGAGGAARRVKEAARMGFARVILPEKSAAEAKKTSGVRLLGVADVDAAVEVALT
jgi:DNA repair protein RadA/Sms